MEIKFYSKGEIENDRFNFAVIFAAYKGKWIYVRNRERKTWEVPAGHREVNEDIDFTASRELFEETGAAKYEIEAICDYSVTIDKITTYGRLFYAKITELGPLPDSEICEVSLYKGIPEALTYPEIFPHLRNKAMEYLKTKITGSIGLN